MNILALVLNPLVYIIVGVVGIVLAVRMRVARGLVITAMALLLTQSLIFGGTSLATSLAAMPVSAQTVVAATSGIVQLVLGVAMWVLIFIALVRRDPDRAGLSGGQRQGYPQQASQHGGYGQPPGAPGAPPPHGAEPPQGGPHQYGPRPGYPSQQPPPSDNAGPGTAP